MQTNSDFDAKPMVMLLGQYSTGKTTFIKHLLRTSYPGKLSFLSLSLLSIPTFVGVKKLMVDFILFLLSIHRSSYWT